MPEVHGVAKFDTGDLQFFEVLVVGARGEFFRKAFTNDNAQALWREKLIFEITPLIDLVIEDKAKVL